MSDHDLETLRRETTAFLTVPRRRRGQFLICTQPSALACVPVSLVPSRLTAAQSVSAVVDVAGPTLAWSERLAVACRQDLWRRLRGRRGMVPVIMVTLADRTALLCLSVGWLDGTIPAPATRGVLATLAGAAAVRRNRQWADRVLPRHNRAD